MPVVETSLPEPRQRSRTLGNPVRLTVESDDMRLSQVNCFYSGKPIPTSVDENTFAFTLDSALPVGRSRVNCTAPSISQTGRYYWYSVPFFVADEQGNYPD